MDVVVQLELFHPSGVCAMRIGRAWNPNQTYIQFISAKKLRHVMNSEVLCLGISLAYGFLCSKSLINQFSLAEDEVSSISFLASCGARGPKNSQCMRIDILLRQSIRPSLTSRRAISSFPSSSRISSSLILSSNSLTSSKSPTAQALT